MAFRAHGLFAMAVALAAGAARADDQTASPSSPSESARSLADQIVAADNASKPTIARGAEAVLRLYLLRHYPAKIEHAVASATTISVTVAVSANAGRRGDWFLAEWPVWQPAVVAMHFSTTWPLHGSSGTVAVPRFAEDGRDRLLSRFVVIRRRAAGDLLASFAHWTDVFPVATTLANLVPRNKKGLAGFVGDPLQTRDVDAFGVGSVTVNLFLNTLFQDDPAPGAAPVTAAGHTWYLRLEAWEKLDATLLAAAERHLVVLGIILLSPAPQWAASDLGALLQHPNYEHGGICSMPNLTTPEGAAAYVMVLDALAKRYERADGRYGRIHRWIVHNEVDAGGQWTNAGWLPELAYLDQYYRSMRLTDLVVRRQDPSAEVLVSLTHNWASAESRRFPPRTLLEDLIELSRDEGDFPWGVAYHAYPSLHGELPWSDPRSTFSFDTPRITFRNVEVLDAWMRRRAARYEGRTVRDVYLSELGANSRDYGASALAEQAAALAYVWRKIAPLSTILGFDYHNWRDNREEGGLRIGLRRFPDDPEDPSGAKPAWFVYRALGTPDEDRATAFALPLIGAKSWSAALRHPPIAKASSKP
jgi:hypothetical protein